jgi:mRNA-degrading endonuclease RelE of RelBE toxin-antitoxin system
MKIKISKEFEKSAKKLSGKYKENNTPAFISLS